MSVIPVLCFVDAALPLRQKNRTVMSVRLCGPKGLSTMAIQEGPLDDELRFTVAHLLAAALPTVA